MSGLFVRLAAFEKTGSSSHFMPIFPKKGSHLMETYAQSESIKNIAKALASAQASGLRAVKSEKNPFYKSTYADLASCWEAVRDSLTSNGVAVVQLPHAEDGLVTMLTHESGEWIRSLMIQPIKDSLDVQKRGAAITYMRRFALMAAVGIAPEDDDGNKANEPAKSANQPIVRKEVYLSSRDDHKARLMGFMTQAGIEDVDLMKDLSSKLNGKAWDVVAATIVEVGKK